MSRETKADLLTRIEELEQEVKVIDENYKELEKEFDQAQQYEDLYFAQSDLLSDSQDALNDALAYLEPIEQDRDTLDFPLRDLISKVRQESNNIDTHFKGEKPQNQKRRAYPRGRKRNEVFVICFSICNLGCAFTSGHLNPRKTIWKMGD